MKKVQLLYIFLIVIFLKGILFSLAVPLWHGPDEQGHFAQVANIAEQTELQTKKNSNREVYETEILLGTYRDSKGNNKFTFHPEYRIEYSDSTIGKYEEYIATFPAEFRDEVVFDEATLFYPPLYYWISALFYSMVYGADFITRVFITRIFGILLLTGTVYLAYLSGRELFKQKIQAYTLAVMVGFQPMLNFVFATVNSDNLMNFLFSAGIFVGLLIVKRGLNIRLLLIFLLILLLGLLTKHQFILLAPIIYLAIIFGLFRHYENKRIKKLSLIILLMGVSFLGLVLILKLLFGISLFSTLDLLFVDQKVGELSVFQHLKNSLIQTYREALPWYWGVFNWLGVVLPRTINRLLNIMVAISIIGFGLKVILIILQKKLMQFLPVLYMACAAIIYYLGIVLFDYFYIQGSGGITIGIQGRYFFPTIISHMVVVLVGLLAFVPEKKVKLQLIMQKGIGVWFVILHFIGLFIILSSYYSFASFTTFFNQLSQYKPLFYKYPLVLIWIILYFLSLFYFVLNYLSLRKDEH